MTEAQKKAEAWALVERLVRQANEALVQVNEGPCEQAQLGWIEDKARVQQKLWA